MSTPKPPDEGNMPPEAGPPLIGLVNLLRSHGFMVTTDDYVHLLKILERYGNEPAALLALRICPIIAITAEEQERFYHVFAAYSRQEKGLGSSTQSRHIFWKKLALLLLAIAVTIGVNIIAGTPRFKPPIVVPPYRMTGFSLMPDSPYHEDLLQAGLLTGREADTSQIQVVWEDSGRDIIGKGFRLDHAFKEPGTHTILRKITSDKLRIKDGLARQEIFVCQSVAEAQIIGEDKPVSVHATILLRATTTQKDSLIKAFQWNTSGLTGAAKIITQDSSSLRVRFDTPGIYEISCMPVTPLDDRCRIAGTASIRVVDTGRQYELVYKGSGAPLLLQKDLDRWPAYLVFALIAISASWGFRRKPDKKPKQQTTEESPRNDISKPPQALRPPYEVPFPQTTAADIVMDKPLRRFLQVLRFKAEEEEQVPDVHKSIRATIRAGGMTELVFTPKRRIQEYLLFIDGSSPQGLMNAFYQHLGALIESEGIPATVFVYDHDFTCTQGSVATKWSLRSIADNYPGAIPVILGDGAALMHAYGGMPKPELIEQWRRWDAVLFITPVPRAEWRMRETLLARHFIIAPADAAALERLGQDFKTGRRLRLNTLSDSEENIKPDFKTVAGLKAYLDNDEAIFQWLCALCVYPKPRWELLTAFGKVVLERYERSADLTYDNLLRLCRIPWLAEGSFPPKLRLALLKTLSVENEVAARAALIGLLQTVSARYSGDHIFSDEQRLQETISGFVLYANDPQRFAAQAGTVEAFKNLLKDGSVTDVPGRKYLEGGGEKSWETPITESGKPSGQAHFIEAEAQQEAARDAAAMRKLRDARWTKRFVAGTIIVALIAIWSILYFGTAGQTLPVLNTLYSTDSSQLVTLKYSVQKDFTACGDSEGRFNVLPATLNVNGKPVGMPFDALTQTISAKASYRELAAALPALSLGISGAGPAEMSFDRLTPGGTIIARCIKPELDTGRIIDPGTPAVLPSYLNEIWSGKTNNRLLNINLTKGMIYYSTGGTDTWGTSHIENVLGTKDSNGASGYRIVVNVYPGYMVFFLKNVRADGFRMAFCQNTFKARADALKAPEDCAAYDEMKLYYPKDDAKIYLPVASRSGARITPVNSELRKLLVLVAQGSGDAPGPLVISYGQWRNESFLTSSVVDDAAMRQYLAIDMQNIGRLIRDRNSHATAHNPFQREYVVLQISYDESKFQQTNQKANLPVRSKLITPNQKSAY